MDVMDLTEIGKTLLDFPETWKEYLPDGTTAVYKTGDKDSGGKIFALVAEKTKPLQVTLKSDSQLSMTLREKFETVLAANNLNKKYWNTIILTGQLPTEDLKSLMIISYKMAHDEIISV